jgi:hypothetical protein
MTQALLTWNKHGEIVTELVTLVPNDAPIYGMGASTGVELPFTTTDMLNSVDAVFFEDENGIFALDPTLVVSVEVLEDDDPRTDNTLLNENNQPSKESVMDTIKKAARSTKNFVSKHRVGIAVVTTALAVGQLQRKNLEHWNAFLEDKGLQDEYYNNY